MNSFDSRWLTATIQQEQRRVALLRFYNRRIVCPLDGKVELTKTQYAYQLGVAAERWICPICGSISEWDDDSFQEEPEHE